MLQHYPRAGTPNHNYPGSVAYILGAYVAGIQPGKPGFAEVVIAPQMGDLTHVEQKLETVRSLVSATISLEKHGSELLISAQTPSGMVTRVGVPKCFKPAVIEVNGVSVWRDGTVLPQAGVQDAGSDRLFYYFSSPGGNHNYLVKASESEV